MTLDYWHEAKAHLSKKDKVLKKIIASYDGEILTKKGDAFLTLARAIVGQQISVKAADTVWKRFSQKVGKITPKNVLATSDADLRIAGLSGQKVSYMRSLAEYFTENKKNHCEVAQNDRRGAAEIHHLHQRHRHMDGGNVHDFPFGPPGCVPD